MKIRVCDFCRCDKKMTVAGWGVKVKKGFQHLTVDVCAEHKTSVKSYDQALELLIKSEAVQTKEVA